MITITHRHADGTVADGAWGSEESGAILERHGFIGMPSLEVYGIRDSRDRAAKRRVIHQAADELRTAGFPTDVSIDDSPRDYETVQRTRHLRLEGRREAIQGKSDRLAGEASALLHRSDALVDGIPLGQPVFAGKRGRWQSNAQRGSVDALLRAGQSQQEAERKAERARASLAHEQRGERPDVIARRAERLAGELRSIEAAIHGAAGLKPATGLYAEELAAQRAVLLVQLTGDRAALDRARADGTFGRWTKADLHPGDLLRIRDEWRQLVRANTKSVSVTTGYSWTDRYGYEQITNVRCPHQDQQHAPENPKEEG